MGDHSDNQPRLREAWVLFFILGVVMLNYPFLQIFNKTTTFFGIPLLILYFLLGWPASILVIYLFSRSLPRRPRNQPADKQDPGGSE
ncbi:hypothetical protein JCM30471_10110 [Desulfuromonas carbonis]|uniref:hypothetical protein n=1 Tax=Desulfuromonas sp. DDH964 TaxID=1823759 RepID=UPI00078B1A57|nr:hypothetical protein [Desulfuromonas sp. DDH964]AMV72493.1 hypothetical protein DBW_2151 [Desulfuromonas sp. DDH964]